MSSLKSEAVNVVTPYTAIGITGTAIMNIITIGQLCILVAVFTPSYKDERKNETISFIKISLNQTE